MFLMQCAVLILALAMTNTPKTEPRYVPRSKRTWAGRMMKRGWAMMTAWIEETLDYVADKCSTTTSRTKAARRIAMGMQGQRGKWKRRIPAAIAMAAIAMPATNAFGEPIRSNAIQFDTDSGRVGVDNRCSACISHKIGDFAGPIHDVRRAIKGFGGETTHNVKMGTLDWSWCDNQGKVHRFRIPNSYYVPQGGVRLLSPQHWAKTQGGVREGAGETTTSHKCTLFWDQRKSNLDIPIGKSDNVATFSLAPGFQNFELFCQEARIDYEESLRQPIIVDANIISDSEDDEDIVPAARSQPTTTWQPTTGLPSRPRPKPDEELPSPTPVHFHLNGPTTLPRPTPVVIEEEEDKQPTTATAELLQYHQRWAHVSFPKLREMARMGIIPSRLKDCPIPTCSACMYVKATRRRWRDKTRQDKTVRKLQSRQSQESWCRWTNCYHQPQGW